MYFSGVLNPTGETKVCVRRPNSNYYTEQITKLTLTCTAQGALWSISGFSKGLEDQTRVSAVSLALSSTRVTTTDTSTLTNSSRITIFDFTYDDHGATVTCDSLLPGEGEGQSATIVVGKCTSQ